jgi:opacity protein-like surface antigen
MSKTPCFRNSRQLILAALVMCFIGTAATAHAQGFISPLVGYDFGGDAKCPTITVNCQDKQLNFGVGVGLIGTILGFEEELAYALDFCGTASGLSTNVLTVMSNVMIAPKLGPVRPYVLAGAGLMKSHVELTTASVLTTDNNTFGWDFGGGVMGFFGSHVGVRADLRYFRSFQDFSVLGFTLANSKLNFGRAGVGVVFKF